MARLPLEDVKILDFMWVMAGPAGSRMLADYGAVIVRVESPTRIDTARTLAPYHNNQIGPDASGLFSNCNAGKFGITLDIGNPRSREVIFDLVKWADVVTESFSPKAMRAWGLDYPAIRKIKPDIIMLSTCLMGQTGPLASFAGFGNLAAAISGFFNITGWPDRSPAGPFGAYTDYVSPRFTAIAILAALEYRRRTGKGQYIDQSQAEASLHFLTPALLDYSVNGRTQFRAGNSDAEFAPHGIYPSKGEDRWVAIVCKTDDDFRALCEVMKHPELARDRRFKTAAQRRENASALDDIIASWSREFEPARRRADAPGAIHPGACGAKQRRILRRSAGRASRTFRRVAPSDLWQDDGRRSAREALTHSRAGTPRGTDAGPGQSVRARKDTRLRRRSHRRDRSIRRARIISRTDGGRRRRGGILRSRIPSR